MDIFVSNLAHSDSSAAPAEDEAVDTDHFVKLDQELAQKGGVAEDVSTSSLTEQKRNQMEEERRIKKLFVGLVFYLSREVSLIFVLRCSALWSL